MSRFLVALALIALAATATADDAPLLVFVTKNAYSGANVGSTAAARNSLCQAEAIGAGLGGSYVFKAIISNGGNADTLIPSGSVYFVNSVGDEVAASYNSFYTSLRSTAGNPHGGLLADILTVDGEFSDYATAWTGFTEAGTTDSNCAGWTSTTGSANVGAFHPASDLGLWFGSGNKEACSQQRPLICVAEPLVGTCNGKYLAQGATTTTKEVLVYRDLGARKCYFDASVKVGSGYSIGAVPVNQPGALCCSTMGRIQLNSAKTKTVCRSGCTGFEVDSEFYKALTLSSGVSGDYVGQICFTNCAYLG